MKQKPIRSTNLIQVEAIIVAYAMSRLDKKFLRRFSFSSWTQAFEAIGTRLGVRAASMKNLRDEFDPIHQNTRRGWHRRPLRPNRQRVLGEFCDASDEAVIEIVVRLLEGDREIEDEVTKPLAQERNRVENVAERLRTGRFAEEYFLRNSEEICGVRPALLVDVRLNACGFDFGVSEESTAIEVKGLKPARGPILFTDNEWSQANQRRQDYWLVVVGNLDREPRAKLFKHAASLIQATSIFQQQTTISWRATVEVT